MNKINNGMENMTMDDLSTKYADKVSEESINDAEMRAGELKENNALKQIWDKIQLLFAIAKQPKEFGPKIAIAVGAVLLYLVAPIDIIPDAIPVVGYTDDVAAILTVIKTLTASMQQMFARDPERFLALIPERLRPVAIVVFKLFASSTESTCQ